MWLVPKYSSSPTPGCRRFPTVLSDAFYAYGRGDVSASLRGAVVKNIELAYNLDEWIACACREGEDVYPMLCPAHRLDTGTYYVRSLNGPDRDLHDASCPFHLPHREEEAEPTSTPIVRSRLNDGMIRMLGRPPQPGFQREPSESVALHQSCVQPSAIARLLWTLLDRAAQNRTERWASQRTQLTDALSALSAAAEGFEITPGVGLDTVLSVEAREVVTRALVSRIRHASRHPSWETDRPPEGFLVTYAKEVTSEYIQPGYGPPIEFLGRLRRPLKGKMAVDGPYCCIVHFGRHPNRDAIVPLKAYAQPVLQGTLMPVDSQHEREVLRVLLEARRDFLAASEELGMSLSKPLFDLPSERGPVRPSFFLDIGPHHGEARRTLAIEAWSADDAAEVAKSQTAQSRLAALCDVVPCAAYVGGWEGRLRVAVSKWAMKHAGVSIPAKAT